jgi:hypothetical protein
MMRLILILAVSSVALADSKSDRDRIAELNRQNADLIQQIKASIAGNQSELLKLRAQVAARSKDAASLAASGRSEAKATASGQSDAIATVQQSTDAIQLQIAQLKAASPVNSVPVWLAAIALIGTFFGTLGTVILAIINHTKTSVIEQHVNGMVEKMGAAREQKGRDDARAEDREVRGG